MIPFEFEAPIIKTLSLKYLKTLKSKHPYFTQFITQNFPLECIICATKPHFIISDCHHSIICQFTKSGLLNFKKAYYYKIRTLKGRYIAIREYFPHCKVVNNTITELYIVITSFEIIKGSNISYAPEPNVPPVTEAPEIKEMFEAIQSHSFKLALKPSEGEISDIEEQEDPQALANVKAEDASEALRRLIEEGIGDMLEDEDELVNYENVDEEEQIAEERAKKMKYEIEEDSDESAHLLDPLKDEIVKSMDSNPNDNYTSKILLVAANLSIPSDYHVITDIGKLREGKMET